MEIFVVDPHLINKGRHSFRVSVQQYLGASEQFREIGASTIPGAIVAAIEFGFNTRATIVRMVARVSRCRQSTVEKVLRGLCGPARLWTIQDGFFRLTDCPTQHGFPIMMHGGDSEEGAINT